VGYEEVGYGWEWGFGAGDILDHFDMGLKRWEMTTGP
jgi:hypothetical protein